MAIFRFCENGGRPPYWIRFMRLWTTHEEHLVVFATLQNLVGIGALVSVICKFEYFAREV